MLLSICWKPGTGDGKPQRAGMLPSYGFSFKCNERAEKRREVSFFMHDYIIHKNYGDLLNLD